MFEITAPERHALDLVDLDSDIDPETENAWYEKVSNVINSKVNLIFPTDADEDIDYDQFLLQSL